MDHGATAEGNVSGCSYIARPGQINAWDNEDFVAAVKKTGRKQLILAGGMTDVCVAFPALSAMAEAFVVFVVTDAQALSIRLYVTQPEVE